MGCVRMCVYGDRGEWWMKKQFGSCSSETVEKKKSAKCVVHSAKRALMKREEHSAQMEMDVVRSTLCVVQTVRRGACTPLEVVNGLMMTGEPRSGSC